MRKHFHIKTYGCQMNVYDSDAMARLLKNEGWTAEGDAASADLIILNTCHIREKATEKIYSEIGRLKKIKTPKSMIAVAGCVAQAEGKAMIARAPVIDFVFGPQNFQQLPQMIAAAAQGKKSVETEFYTEEKFSQLKENHLRAARHDMPPVSAFLTVQEGCDKFCSFCVVPYTRGNEISRAPEDILAEAKTLLKKGAKEIVLLGQNVNAYHYDRWKLSDLFDALSDLRDLKRLRYITSHPSDMSEDLILAHRDNPKLMPYLHLPVQSGSDAILKKMNRRHSSNEYRMIIKAIRHACPDIALSSDFIVGFPEETEQDFSETLNLVMEIGFAQAYSFKYSPRAGTKAAEAKQIPNPVKVERLAKLQKLLESQRIKFHRRQIGKKMEVLVEKPFHGKTRYGQNIFLDQEVERGSLVKVEISHAAPNHLMGVVA